MIEERLAPIWPPVEARSHEAGLTRLRLRGWRPRFVYDIGASTGAWTATAARVFPLAEFHLFEPLARIDASYRGQLDVLAAQPGLRLRVHPVALADRNRSEKMGISVDPMGSSILANQTSEWFPQVIDVDTTALDHYVEHHDLPPPDLLKIDTQGSELRILEGARRTLRKTALLIVETWLHRGYGPDTPLLHEVVAWLAAHKFLVIDKVGDYREGGKLVTMDLLFSRRDVDIDRRP